MNIRFTILLVVILVVIGGTVWITQRQPDDSSRDGKDWIWKLELEDMRRIAINHEDSSVAYGRETSGWVIKGEGGNNTPVYQPKWGGKALVVSGPKPSRTLDEITEDPALYGLDPVGTTVTITDRSGQQVVFELGAITPDGSNQYVRLDDGSLHTLPKIWGEVVVSLATRPPYKPPFITVLEDDEVVEMRVQVRADAETISAEAVYLLTGLQEGESEAGVPEQWIFLEEDSVLVNERWEGLISGLGNADLQTESETFEDLPDLDSLKWSVRLDMRNRQDARLAFFVYDATADPARRYIWSTGDETLSSVNDEWVQALITLAEEPAVTDAPPDNPSN